MSFLLGPGPILRVTILGLLNRRQQQIIEFQNVQTEALLKKFGRKRRLLDDDQRRLLAVKGLAIGRKALRELTSIVTPDTILRRNRVSVAKTFDFSQKNKRGHPLFSFTVPKLSAIDFFREHPIVTEIFRRLSSLTLRGHRSVREQLDRRGQDSVGPANKELGCRLDHFVRLHAVAVEQLAVGLEGSH